MYLITRRFPTGFESERREVTRPPFSIGRAPDNDWTLPDPGRVLSKRHCRITANGDTWLVTDTSSNGTFLNDTSLDPGVPHALHNGDRLMFGAYEIEVQLGEVSPVVDADTGLRPALSGRDSGEDRQTGDVFSSLDDDPLEAARPSIGLPPDFDPLGSSEAVAESSYAVPDHVAELEAHFRAPRPNFELLPEDWNTPPEPSRTPMPPAPTPLTPAPATPMSPEPLSPAPPSPAPPSPAPPPLTQLPSAPLPPPPMPALPPLEAPAVATAAADAGDTAGFAAFAAGARIAGTPAGDPRATLAALGAAFRAVVSGLRRTMIARATIKGEFRIEQTMIRAAGNNPLKFSADDDDALAALLGIGRQLGMSPGQAITEALRDMRWHELAVASAMQQAVRDVLSELEPERVMREVPSGMLQRLSGASERRAWQRYAALHARTMRALADDFDSVFGKSFVRAYEAALADIAAQDAEADA